MHMQTHMQEPHPFWYSPAEPQAMKMANVLLYPATIHTYTHMQASTLWATTSFDVVLRSLMTLQRQVVSRESVHQTVFHWKDCEYIYKKIFQLSATSVLIMLNFNWEPFCCLCFYTWPFFTSSCLAFYLHLREGRGKLAKANRAYSRC